ncbi:MAG TPA: hypothetical protein VL099_05620 [Candidatus Binatia bacterium]|nr:hypothetical protein [Candidatus Binatia bacterium]
MMQPRISNNRKWAVMIAAGGILVACLVLALSLFAPGLQANGSWQPPVFDRDSVVYGRTYGEWSAAWWQWAFSIPVDKHPLFDNPDCSVGQSGPVWFLGGSFVSNTAVRNCTVPAATALYVPILNGEDSSLEEALGNGCSKPAATGVTIADLRPCAASYIAGAMVSFDVDGVPIHDVAGRFHEQSIAFGFTLPDNNFLAAADQNPAFVKGTYFPAVDDGYYVMVAPLPPGHHTVHFHGSVPSSGFTLDVTYHLTVQH